VRIKNVTSKTITYAKIELIFPSTNAQGEYLGLLVRFESDGSIPPGEEARLEASKEAFKSLAKKNAEKGYKLKFNRIKLEPSIIKFDDGTSWILGATINKDGEVSSIPRAVHFFNASFKNLTPHVRDDVFTFCQSIHDINGCSAISNEEEQPCNVNTPA
jgi:hypothetical protein